jgi:hypothetical protein
MGSLSSEARDTGRRAVLALALLALALLPACERGCLMKAARDHGVTPEGSLQTPTTRGQDCVPDLLRCRDGVVERSLGGFVPESCTGSVERCSCPWRGAGACPSGCAKDDLEVALATDGGAAQLCAAAPAAVIGGTLPEGLACDEPGEVVCQASVVVRCERPPRLLATCTHGCALADLAAEVPDRAAVMLACAR